MEEVDISSPPAEAGAVSAGRIPFALGVENSSECMEVVVRDVHRVDGAGRLELPHHAYTLVTALPGGTTVTTEHRYSDFEALRAELVEDFPGIVVPALPDKAPLLVAASKLIARVDVASTTAARQRTFERWLRYVTTHPILRGSETLLSFLRGEWEARARRRGIGAHLRGMASALRGAAHGPEWLRETKNYSRQVHSALGALQERVEDLSRRRAASAAALRSFGDAMCGAGEVESARPGSSTATTHALALVDIGKKTQQVAEESEGRAGRLSGPVGDTVRFHLCLAAALSDTVDAATEAFARSESRERDAEKRRAKGKATEEADDAARTARAEAEAMEAALRADVARVHSVRAADIGELIDSFVKTELRTQSELRDAWVDMLDGFNLFDQTPPTRGGADSADGFDDTEEDDEI